MGGRGAPWPAGWDKQYFLLALPVKCGSFPSRLARAKRKKKEKKNKKRKEKKERK